MYNITVFRFVTINNLYYLMDQKKLIEYIGQQDE